MQILRKETLIMTQKMRQIPVKKGYQEDRFCIHKNVRTAFRELQCVHTVLMES